MKQKNMILLALALGCGLVAAFLTAKLSASKGEMIPVLVAAKNLDQGTKLDKPEDLFVRKPFPKESVPPEFIDDIALLKGKNLQRTIRAGSHLTQADVTPRNTVDLPVDPATGVQYKAMALRVNPETIVGGLVLPGSRVDVVNVERINNGKTVATMILQNVLVVGVDVNVTRNDTDGFIKNAQTVTMAVKQQEGLVLALAQERGKMFLMLRDPTDNKVNKNLKQIADYVQKAQDEGSIPEGTSTELTKIPVARKLVPAGTKIDDPADYFDEQEWPSTSVSDNFVTKMDDLRGRTVAKDVLPKLPVTKEAFDGDAPATGIANNRKPENRHTITFQVGGSTPYYAHFKDGKLEEGFAMPAVVPSSPGTDIKPREKPMDKPDQGH